MNRNVLITKILIRYPYWYDPDQSNTFYAYVADMWKELSYGSGTIAPSCFRSGIFLHHSTGSNIWGPNGSITSVPQEMAVCNSAHGYTGAQVITMNEE